MKHKFLLVGLILLLSLSLFAETYSGTCGTNLTWTLDTESGILTISGTGAMTNYITSYSNVPWYSSRTSIKTVIIEDDVTSIGYWAFHDCSSLTYVKIGNSVTSIEGDAFCDCVSLTSITIPNSVTSIGNSAFYGCSSLASVTIPNSVTSIGNYAFSYCSSLTSITIPNSVTSIGGGAFRDCISLSSITIPNSVTSIGGDAFRDCISLPSITIPNSVTSIGSDAFSGCSGLNSVHISDIAAWCKIAFGNNVANPLSRVHNLYLNGTLVTDLIIPDGVTSIGNYAFSYCSSLTSVTIPNSVTSIGDYAFYNCSGLTSVTIPNGVTSIGNYAFYNCSSLTSIDIPNSVTSIGERAFSGCKSLTFATIGNRVTSIEEYTFYNCSSLTYVTIGNSVTSIRQYAFSGCSGLTSIMIPNSVISIGSYAFSSCSSLTSATIGNSVTSIGERAFSGCSSLTSATIGNSVTSIGKGAFSGCKSLTSLEIPNSVISIGNEAFKNCSNLTSVIIPSSVTSIGNSVFSGCSSLTSVHISDIAAWCKIAFSDSYANPLRYAYNLYLNGTLVANLIIPDGVTRIGDYAFYGCSLTSVTIPNSVTNIESNAFNSCGSLTSAMIGNSVTSIGGSAFSNCSSLSSITCQAVNPPSLGTNVFNNVDKSIPLYVPAQSISAYSAADQWKDFFLKSIEDVKGTIVWKNYDGSVLATDNDVPYGTMPQYNGATPTRPADEDNTYTFSGWTPAVVAVAGNATYTATFQSVPFVKYTITWQDEDGNIINTDEVKQGTIPAFTGTTPTKDGYDFAGWLPNIKPAMEDTKYTTYFIPTQQAETPVYTVNINGENCSLNISNQYPEGAVITVEAVADECFEFNQWSDGSKQNPRTITVTKDANLTAEFNKVRYTITDMTEPGAGGKIQVVE